MQTLGVPYAADMDSFIEALGGHRAIALMLDIKVPSVYSWNGRIPKERCPDIERLTAARFTVEQMRPDVTWQRVPDPEWPHPGGRPCIDVAAPVA